MPNDALIARLMKTFLGEAEEHVQALNQNLLQLEKQGGAERGKTFKSLFRTAHSLKGAANAVKVPILELACHKLEELFGAASEGRRSVDPELFRLLFAVADGIQDVIHRLRERTPLDDAPLGLALPRLDAAIAGHPGTPPAGPPAQVPEVQPVRTGVRQDQLVRIPAERLDALLAHSNELMVARRRAELRSEDAARLQESLQQWRAEWMSLSRSLERLVAEDGDRADPGLSTTTTSLRARAAPKIVASMRRAVEGIGQIDRNLQQLAGNLGGDQRMLARMAGGLDNDVRRARLLPFAEACVGLERVVRDLAATGGKEIELLVEGADLELDRSILEGLKDPLLHLVRNSVDHGIEPAAARRAAGKPTRGRITVSAKLRGSMIEVTVADDGAGLDIAAIRARASQKQLPDPKDDDELARSILLPGFSTATTITEISGRGVGLDAVKAKVESLRGTVDLSFGEGRGLRVILLLPLTLTTIRALLAEVTGQIFAFDSAAIERLLRIAPSDVGVIDGRDVLTVEGAPIPVVALAELLDLGADDPSASGDRPSAMVLAAGGHRVVIRVDQLLAEQEVVIRSLGRRLGGLPLANGGAVLPDGGIALILNAAELARQAVRHTPTRAPARAGPSPVARRRLIVVDDSITTRMLEKSILESAGFEVLVAANGLEAWRLLQEHGADLVVSDVQMSEMDGIDLTRTIRNSSRFRTLPVILVTGRESEADKVRGLEVGADAYLLKSAFDQTLLLKTIHQIL